MFCGGEESVNHLFLSCPFAKYVWAVVQCSVDIQCLPNTVEDLGDSWLSNFPKKVRGLVSVGIAAVLWTLWKTRNDACFQRKSVTEPTSVLFQIYHWIYFWSGMQKEDRQEELRSGSKRM